MIGRTLHLGGLAFTGETLMVTVVTLVVIYIFIEGLARDIRRGG
jgi:hypothetical protein